MKCVNPGSDLLWYKHRNVIMILILSTVHRSRRMVLEGIPTGYEIRFLIDIGIAVGAGFAIDAERESRSKPAGISTHCYAIGGSMIFTFLSSLVDPNSSSRICGPSGIRHWLLGSRHYLKSEIDKKITNVITGKPLYGMLLQSAWQ